MAMLTIHHTLICFVTLLKKAHVRISGMCSASILFFGCHSEKLSKSLIVSNQSYSLILTLLCPKVTLTRKWIALYQKTEVRNDPLVVFLRPSFTLVCLGQDGCFEWDGGITFALG